MSAELDQLAKYYAQRGDQPRSNLYSTLAAEERAKGTPESLSSKAQAEVITIEQIEADVEPQAKRYLEREFHKRLRISSGRFKDQILGLVTSQPEAFRERFNIPAVVIGTKIPLKDQYKMIGVNYYLEGLTLSSWYSTKYQTPDAPHLVWMQDGKINLGRSVDLVRANLATDERGANIYDGLGLLNARPNVLQDHSIDLPGTRVGSDYAPYLLVWGGRPGVGYGFTDRSYPHFGSASCGKV